MGQHWSSAAGKTFDNITRSCVKQSGRQNVYSHGGNEYFWESDGKTYADGSIGGTIHKLVRGGAVPAGRFKIDGKTGKVTRGASLAAISGGPGINMTIKKERFTLQKYTYHGFQRATGASGAMIYVDLAHKHPDPAKRLLWGYDKAGNMVSGDYIDFFKKVGRPQTFEFKQTGKFAADEKKVRHAAIVRAIKKGW